MARNTRKRNSKRIKFKNLQKKRRRTQKYVLVGGGDEAQMSENAKKKRS